MANMQVEKKWSPVRILESHELARGGLNGNMNEQAKALAERTEFLNDKKANKEDLNAIAGGKYAYSTYELMISDALNIKSNSSIDITNDPDQTKNGSYTYDGTVFTKSEYDPLNQSKKYSEELHKEALNTVNNLGTFPEIKHDELDYAIADENGNIALGINKSGEVSITTAQIKKIENEGSVLLDIENPSFCYAIADENGNVVFGIKADGSIYPKYEQSSEIETILNIKPQKTDWIHGHTYGQSLSRGSGSYPVVSTTQPYKNLTFTSGVLPRLSDTHDYSATKPLIEQRWNTTGAEGESPTSGMLNKITELALQDGDDLIFFGASSGQGGTPLENLSKGTTRYNEQLEMYKAAYALAQSRGLSYSVGVIGFVQGESNYNRNNSRNEYKSLLVQLKRDLDADIQPITNQDFVPIMVTYQTASHFVASTRRNHTNIALAQWDAHRENIDIVMACSMYSIEYLADNLHLTADSSLQLGKYLGKAAYKTIQHAKGLSDKPFAPLEPIHAIWQGKIIDITFNVPEGNLTLDTTLVSQTHNYGFDIWFDDAVQENAIQSVSIVDKNRVRIVLAQQYENAVLSYARGRPTDPIASGPIDGPRGNLRDQAGDTDNYLDSKGVTRYMHNWCVIFQYSQNTGFN